MRESATKKVLAESLKELMLRRDFTDITVTDLCAAAEINRRTFYRHFTDKYQLVTWIYDKGFQKAIGDDEPGLFDLFGRVCTYLYADRAFYARALTFTGQNSFHDFLCARLRPYLQADFSDLFPDPQTEAFMSGKMSWSWTSFKTGSAGRTARRRRCLPPGRCTCGRTSWGGGRSSAMRGSTHWTTKMHK